MVPPLTDKLCNPSEANCEAFVCMPCMFSNLYFLYLRYAERQKYLQKNKASNMSGYKAHRAFPSSFKQLPRNSSNDSLFSKSTVSESPTLPLKIKVENDTHSVVSSISRRLSIKSTKTEIDKLNFEEEYEPTEGKPISFLELPILTSRSLHFDSRLWATVFGDLKPPAIVDDIVFPWNFGAITYTDTVANTPVRRALGHKFKGLFKTLRNDFNDTVVDAGSLSSIVHQLGKGLKIEPKVQDNLRDLIQEHGSLTELLQEVRDREEDLSIICKAIKHLFERKPSAPLALKPSTRSGKAGLALRQAIEEGKTFHSRLKNIDDISELYLDDSDGF